MTINEAQQIIRLKGHTVGTGFHDKKIKRINWWIDKQSIYDCSYVNAEQLKTAASMLVQGIDYRSIVTYLKQKQG